MPGRSVEVGAELRGEGHAAGFPDNADGAAAGDDDAGRRAGQERSRQQLARFHRFEHDNWMMPATITANKFEHSGTLAMSIGTGGKGNTDLFIPFDTPRQKQILAGRARIREEGCAGNAGTNLPPPT